MFFIFISKHFNIFLVFNLCISQSEAQRFACCLLLVTFYSLLVACYFLLVARYFLLFARYFVLVTFCSMLVNFLLVAFCLLLVTFCSFAGCLLWNKVTVNSKKMTWLFSMQISEIFVTFSGWWFQSFLIMQNHFQSWDKVTNIGYHYDVSITIFGHAFSSWRVRSSRLEEFYKKDVLTYSAKFTGKHLRWSLFYNKAAGWRPLTSLNTETGAGVFLWIFWNLYKNIYFASACEGMPLINKIFTGVSFRKMLGFYYKLKRQFFYYEGTSS